MGNSLAQVGFNLFNRNRDKKDRKDRQAAFSASQERLEQSRVDDNQQKRKLQRDELAAAQQALTPSSLLSGKTTGLGGGL